jgi:hypothetical protein
MTLFGESWGRANLVASHRMRVVAVGAVVTAVALVNLFVYTMLESHTRSSIGGCLVVIGLGSVGLGVALMTPWTRVLESKWALRVLYGWSVYGVAGR